MTFYPALGSPLELPFLTLTGGSLSGALTLSSGDLSLTTGSVIVAGTNQGVVLGTADANGILLRLNSGPRAIFRTGNNGANTGVDAVNYVSTAGPFYSISTSGAYFAGSTGSPEGVWSGPVGSVFGRTNGSGVYFKGSGTGNTGWIEAPEGLLATVTDIDTSSTAKQTLYTVPASKVAYITKVVVRDPSAAITLCTATFGFNASADDVIAATTLTGLSGATTYQVITPITTGAAEGAAAAVFGMDTTVQEAAADTVTIDVFGYLR